MIVRVAMDDEDLYFEIDAEDALALLELPPESRYAAFIKKAVALDEDDEWEEDLQIDASGNRTDEEFWASEEGYREWRALLGDNDDQA